jgi:predicted alpha/beta hydrolase
MLPAGCCQQQDDAMRNSERTGFMRILTDFRPISLQLFLLVLLLGEVARYIVMALLSLKYLIAAANEGNRSQTAKVIGLSVVSFIVFMPGDEVSDVQTAIFEVMFFGTFTYLIGNAVRRKRIVEALAVVAVMVWLVIWLIRIGRRMGGEIYVF